MVLCLLAYVERDERRKTERALVRNSGRGSMDNCEHLSFDLIKDFAYGEASLNEVQLYHCANCDECWEIWATYKREAKVLEKAKTHGPTPPNYIKDTKLRGIRRRRGS
jgi:hypothetical protein